MIRLLFGTDNTEISQQIKSLSPPDSKWSHVAIILPDGVSLLESTPYRGVHVSDLKQRVRLYEEWEVRELPGVLSDHRRLLDCPFDWAWSKGKMPNQPHAFDCSTLVGYLLDIHGPRYPRLGVWELWDLSHPVSGLGL